MRILQLLEDGKINAEEAARLLEALSQSETKERKRRFWSSIEVIPNVISSAIASSFKYTTSRETLQYPKKKKIEFKGVSGDLEVTGDTTDTIELEKNGIAKISEKENEIGIKAITGDMKIRAPKQTDLEIKGVSGNLNISNMNNRIEMASVSGDVKGKALSGTFIGEFVSGNVDLEYREIGEINIRSRSGAITLWCDEKVAVEVEIETEHGNISCDFALKDEERKGNLLRGVINKPRGKIHIKNQYGDVAIKRGRSG